LFGIAINSNLSVGEDKHSSSSFARAAWLCALLSPGSLLSDCIFHAYPFDAQVRL
jgi:hypothetical protein